MKIALVRPNNRPLAEEESRLYAPPLGLMYLASSLLKQAPEAEIRITDMALEQLDASALAERLRAWEPDLIGLSALSCEAAEQVRVMEQLRAALPGCPTVIGGPHATCVGAELLTDTGSDFLIVGEAERSFPALALALASGTATDAIPGLGFRSNGIPKLNPPDPDPVDLDALPFPAWHLIDLEGYQRVDSFNVVLRRLPYMSLLTSRGCPYRCAYCHNLFGRKVRYRSAESVLAEIEALRAGYGVRELHLVDDIFNLNKKRALAILRGLVERRLDVAIAFPNGLRADLIDDELLDAMRAAGVYAVAYAIESGSPRIQQLVHKDLDLDKARSAIAATRRRGILTAGFFMLGFPTETAEEIEATVEFALSSRLQRAHFFTVVPHPGTALHQLARETYPELPLLDDEGAASDYFAEKPFLERAAGLPVGQVQDRAYRRFYLYRPLRLLRLVAALLWFWCKRLWYRVSTSTEGGARLLEPEAMDDAAEVEAYEELTRDHRTHDDDQIAARVAALIPDDRDIELLDLGCGTGRIDLRLLRACPRLSITAVDLSPGMLAQARRNLEQEYPEAIPRVAFVRADGKRLPFAAGRFDFGLCCYTLHHLERPEEMAREVARVTHADGGLFYYDLRRRRGRLLGLWVRIFTLGYKPRLRAIYRDSLGAALSYRELVRALLTAGIPGLRFERGFFDSIGWRPAQAGRTDTPAEDARAEAEG